jgi:UDP-N-acetylmuramoyl-L-alanyl-D-glutamate--2,6-diaminopimelate ligase
MHAAIARLDQLGIARKRLVVDSREVRAGDVFVAYRGSKSDGRDFIEAATQAGAVAVIAQAGWSRASTSLIPVISVENLDRIIGLVADDFYDRPSASLSVNAVTGTNGKTTVATWLAQAHNALNGESGFIGTLGTGFIDMLKPSKNTTPDAATVHGTLAEMRRLGATSVAMEVSSHALDQGRVAGVRFDTAVFTNLTQDHLDYHGTMEAYGEAKARLFTEYPVRHRVINADDDFGAQLIARHYPNTVSYGLRAGLVRGQVVSATSEGMNLNIVSPWGDFEVSIAAAGAFNAYNATAVAASLLCHDLVPQRVATAMAAMRAAPGRMQRVAYARVADEPAVYVDYAHTPDALGKAIAAARETCRGKLWVVFGCGGDRDASKRPLMGNIAARSADRLVITSDNPRTEPPTSIIAAIIDGIDGASKSRIEQIVDRRDAIAFAIANAEEQDSVLIAGKGHEDYQEIANVRVPFSDVEVAMDALATREQAKEGVHAAH